MKALLDSIFAAIARIRAAIDKLNPIPALEQINSEITVEAGRLEALVDEQNPPVA